MSEDLLGAAPETSLPGHGRSASGEYTNLGPQTVIFGRGSRHDLPEDLAVAGVERVLLLVSASVLRDGLVADLKSRVGSRVAVTFSGTAARVPEDVVLAATQAARLHEVDGIVSVGGGSVSDLGKAVCLALAEDVRDRADLVALRSRITPDGDVEIPTYAGRVPIPHWTIPTTLSAAGFTCGFGITDLRRGSLNLYTHPAVALRQVILDPEATLGTPNDVWLVSGLLSLSHCIECCYSLSAQPLVTALCENALKVLVRDLGRTRRVPGDLDARLSCQIASWQAGLGVTNAAVGLSHAIGHYLGGRYGIPLGILAGATLPAAVQFNQADASDELANLAASFGVSDASEVAAALRSFVRDLGLPTGLAEIGIDETLFDDIATGVLEIGTVLGNPRPVTHAGILEVLRNASR